MDVEPNTKLMGKNKVKKKQLKLVNFSMIIIIKFISKTKFLILTYLEDKKVLVLDFRDRRNDRHINI